MIPSSKHDMKIKKLSNLAFVILLYLDSSHLKNYMKVSTL